MSTTFTDIITVADGPLGTTNINLANSSITLVANSTLGLTVNPTGSVVVGSNAISSPATFFVNGSMVSSLNNTVSTNGGITFDLSTSNNFIVNLSGSALLAAVANASTGQSGIIFLIQPPSGSAVVTYHSSWKWPNGIAPIASTIANAVDAVAYMVLSTSPLKLAAQFISNFS